MARSTFSVEPKRCSKLLPLRRLRMRACTKPRQLPGVTCWTLMIRHTSPSKRMHMPARTWVAWIKLVGLPFSERTGDTEASHRLPLRTLQDSTRLADSGVAMDDGAD